MTLLAEVTVDTGNRCTITKKRTRTVVSNDIGLLAKDALMG